MNVSYYEVIINGHRFYFFKNKENETYYELYTKESAKLIKVGTREEYDDYGYNGIKNIYAFKFITSGLTYVLNQSDLYGSKNTYDSNLEVAGIYSMTNTNFERIKKRLGLNAYLIINRKLEFYNFISSELIKFNIKSCLNMTSPIKDKKQDSLERRLLK